MALVMTTSHRKLIFLFTFYVLFATLSSGNAYEKGRTSSSERVVVCYLGSWAYWRKGDGKFTPSDIDPNLCTHAIYGFAGINKNTFEIQSTDLWLDLPPSETGGGLDNYGEFVRLKQQNPNLKAMLAVGGWNEASKNFSTMAGDATNRNRFVQSAVEFIQKYEFDGLDLDWEYPANREFSSPEDKAHFILLVKELKTEFVKYDLLVTSAIGVGPDILTSAYDFPQLCEHLDFMNLMMYDLHGYFDGVTGHHTSVYNHPNLGEAANSLNQSLHLIESQGGCLNKMVLGMGMYAQTSTLVDSSQQGIGAAVSGAGNAGTYTQNPGFLGYYEVCSQGPEYETDSDEYTMAPWKYYGDQWLSYDNVESIHYKSELAVSKGLLGGMIWSIETDDFKGNCGGGTYPLLNEINKVIFSTDVNTEATVPPEQTTSIGKSTPDTELTTSQSTPTKKLVVCYLGSWAYWRKGDGKFTPSDIDPNLCTHAIYGFAGINKNTFEIQSTDPWLDLPPSETGGGLDNYGEFVRLKQQNPNLKAMLAVGGWNEASKNFSTMAGDATNRNRFVQSAVEFIQKYEFDGLDLDWEYPANREFSSPEDKANFILLVKELKTEFVKYDLLVTSAIGVGPDILTSAYDFPQLCEHLDFLNLMMYDLHGYFDGVTGHHTSVYNHPNLGEAANSLNESLHLIESQGGCLNKMVLGMGMYARTSTLVDSGQHGIGAVVSGPGNAGTFTPGEPGFLGYNEICLQGPEYETDSDEYTMAPWKYYGDQWLSYDNVESIHYKSELAVSKGLLGGMIWSIETDDFKGNCGGGTYPLLNEINKVIFSTDVNTEATVPPEQTTSIGKSTPDTELTTSQSTPTKKLVVCYLGSWAYWRKGDGKFTPSDIDPNLCTHAIYGFAGINKNTFEIQSTDPWLDLPPSETGGGLDNYGEFVRLKQQNPNLKAMLAVGGWNEASKNFSTMAGDATNRNRFVQSAVEFIQKYEFDGLDLDWEYPANREFSSPEDKANFILLVKELKTEFVKYDLLVTSAIGVGPDILTSAYDFPQLCEHLDFLNLMMYDLHGYFDGVTGHHTSVYNHPNLGEAANSLNQSLHLIESQGGCLNKMVLGMGMYARTSTLVDSGQHGIGAVVSGPGNAGTFTPGEPGFLGYNEICLQGPEYETDYDEYTMAPWKYYGDQWLSYDNVESLEFKSNLAVEKGLMGGMIWSIETDDFRGKCSGGKYPLLTTIYNIMAAASESPTTLETTTIYQQTTTMETTTPETPAESTMETTTPETPAESTMETTTPEAPAESTMETTTPETPAESTMETTTPETPAESTMETTTPETPAESTMETTTPETPAESTMETTTPETPAESTMETTTPETPAESTMETTSIPATTRISTTENNETPETSSEPIKETTSMSPTPSHSTPSSSEHPTGTTSSLSTKPPPTRPPTTTTTATITSTVKGSSTEAPTDDEGTSIYVFILLGIIAALISLIVIIYLISKFTTKKPNIVINNNNVFNR